MELLTIILIIIFIAIVSGSIYFVIQHNKSSNGGGGNSPAISCPPGQVLDANGNCVPFKPSPPSQTCPTGQVWDPKSGKCIPYNPSPSNACPTGQVWDPNDDKCVWLPCPNGEIRDKNGNCIVPCSGNGSLTANGCVCNTYYTGANCQCDTRNVPSGYAKDLCRGIGDPKCNSNGTWSADNAPTCQYVYDEFGGSEISWQSNCYSDICKGADTKYNNIANCATTNTGVSINCQRQCPVNADSTDCQECLPDKSNNSTCVCDYDTGYKWKCIKNQTNACLSPTPKGLCEDGTDPTCVGCGLGQFTWHCPNSNVYDMDCIVNGSNLNFFNVTPSNPGNPLPDTKWALNGTNGKPVFPTINNDLCDSRIASGQTPYSNIILDNNHNVDDFVNSQDGFVVGLKGNLDPKASNTKLYVRDPKDKNLVVYNIIQSNYTCSDGNASVQGLCFNGTGTYLPDANNLCLDGTSATEICVNGGHVTGINLKNPNFAIFEGGKYNSADHSYNGQAFQYRTGCMKFPDQYCSGRGTFSQYCFNQNGDLVNCEDPSVYFMDDGGSCLCNSQPANLAGNISPYAGSSCQYSDILNCSNYGTVSADGNNQPVCKCSTGHAGKMCQYDNSYCSNNGVVSSDANGNPICTCNPGYAGNACQYSDSGTCSGHGKAQSNGTCVCTDPNWWGARCSCGNPVCSGNGTANKGSDCACTCNPGWINTRDAPQCSTSTSSTCYWTNDAGGWECSDCTVSCGASSINIGGTNYYPPWYTQCSD